MLKVLMPAFNQEPFVLEIKRALNNNCIVETNFDAFWDVKEDHDIIQIHWPEYLFKWKEPTTLELKFLEIVLKKWKIKSKIIITRHNYYPHYRDTKIFELLYNLIYNYSDGVIHLGNHSLKEFHERYPKLIKSQQKHAVIAHPVFTQYPNTITTEEARRKLKIPKKAFVFLVFGRIKSAEEKNLVLKAFSYLNKKHKILIAPGWKKSGNKEPINSLKWFLISLLKNKYRISNNYIKNADVQYYINAANIIFIPRINTLNSGIPFLVLPFYKPVIGPDCGNISEIIDKMNGFTYQSNNLNTLKNLEINSEVFYKNKYRDVINSISYDVIGHQYHAFYNSIIKK